MAKNLKLNIKNLQLAGALKTKLKSKSSEKQKEESQEEKKEAPKKRASRLKTDASVSSAIKKAEKTLASKGKASAEEAAPKKRKSRIIKDPTLKEPEKEEEPKEQILEPEVIEAEVIPEEALPEKTPEPILEKKEEEPTKEEKKPEKEESKNQAPLAASKPKASPADLSRKPKDLKAPKKKEDSKFDSRDRQGLRDIDNEAWRKRRAFKPKRRTVSEEDIVRPKSLQVRLPISIKDLAHEMKLKASQLVAKLFMQGLTLTLNDYLDDETVVGLLGHEFGCEITIDTSEAERIQITEGTIQDEIKAADASELKSRPAVIAFMGHVDHGKTSLIDTIRKSNRAAGEAGAITQHIGAFKVETKAGPLTILDTPGHEAFSEMRSRGASVTDLVILVVAGDEGIKAQTEEAISQARDSDVPLLVALNKSDKPGFDEQKVYRQLADLELLPEAWGGTTIVVPCSASTGDGIQELLEMVALQAEILELKANPNTRARGTILESEMHKGLGAVATVLVQNGTLKKNDAFVFGHHFGRIKTMHDEHANSLDIAEPATPVKITGLSNLALAGSEFVIVKNEKEAKELAAARAEGVQRDTQMQAKLSSMERMLAKKESGEMKILPVILRADVQGSLEALKQSLKKIKSKKVRLEIVDANVGEISESDVELAAASKATLVGFHTSIESRAEDLIKFKKVDVYTQDVIYHLIDEVKERMRLLLDKIPEENDIGEAVVKAVFKSSQLGNIAGSQVTDGIVRRNALVRQIRNKEVIWNGKIDSLKRVKEDVKEVSKGFECGIVLDSQNDVQEGDILQAYEIKYLEQDL